jgi:hypothetical protein
MTGRRREAQQATEGQAAHWDTSTDPFQVCAGAVGRPIVVPRRRPSGGSSMASSPPSKGVPGERPGGLVGTYC